MSGWPIHEYDPRPQERKMRRLLLVAGEHIAREVLRVLVPVVRWISRSMDRVTRGR